MIAGRKKRCLLITHDALDEKTGKHTTVLLLPAFDTDNQEDVTVRF